MDNRILGAICIIGSALAVLGTLLLRARFDEPDSILVGIIWLAGALAGLLGLIQSNGVGRNPVLRAVAFLPILSIVLVIAWGIADVTGLVPSDSMMGNIGYFGFLIGLVLVGIFTIAAKEWQGWRRFVPLFTLLMFIVGTGFPNVYVGQALAVSSWALLGYVVTTADSGATLAEGALT